MKKKTGTARSVAQPGARSRKRAQIALTPSDTAKVTAFRIFPLCTSLHQLRNHVHTLACEKGWYDEKLPARGRAWFAAAIANIHGEASELWEAFREDRLDQPCDKAGQMQKLGLVPLTCLEEELADIIIRALDMAGYMGVSINRAVAMKHAFNSTRPQRHGAKKA